MICTRKVSDLTGAIKMARENQSSIKRMHDLLHSPHERDICISVGAHSFTVSKVQDGAYVSKAVRGLEMILLGAQRFAVSEVDRARREVAEAEASLREYINGDNE